MDSQTRKAFNEAYRHAMVKCAMTEAEYDDASMAAARKRYQELLNNKALEEIDDDLVSSMKRRRAIARLASLGSLTGLGYGFAKGSKPIMGASAALGALGLLGNRYEDSNLKDYLANPRRRRIENLGEKYVRAGTKADHEALAAMIMDREAGRI